jgi:hypothetical protein
MKPTMKYKKQLRLAIFLIGFGLESLYAHQTIPASGGNATGTGGSASYTVSQVVYTTNTGAGGSAIQGVQVPYEITVVTALDIAKGIDLSYSVYPNPTADNLTLKIEGANAIKYRAILTDVKGKQLLTIKVEGNETSIPMQGYAPAIYFLKITDNNKETKTFKIVKK